VILLVSTSVTTIAGVAKHYHFEY